MIEVKGTKKYLPMSNTKSKNDSSSSKKKKKKKVQNYQQKSLPLQSVCTVAFYMVYWLDSSFI